ncbi:hypothetical protein J3R30DRAFT_3695473 [Lentinula aciculospora]|uniref:Uncharacterized protein n=1 Tax=Lentinula aciculospora TaxID=153920 RepID=A0A9W9AQ12_9AGAR|nr:hypothetical protein J3R30DRAFT_3695473 [Lentinula aciculospora]
MSIDKNHPAVASLPMAFDVDDVLPVPSSEGTDLLLAQNPVHSLSHSLPEPLPAFPNLATNGSVQTMHVATTNLTSAAFMDLPTPLDPVVFSTAASSSATFIQAFNPSFSASSPVENSMAVKLPTASHAASLSPPMNHSVPPHGPASSYSVASSSLQSALEPSVPSPGQHSPSVTLPANIVIPVSSTLIAPPLSAEMNLSSDEHALTIGRDIFDQVVQSASTAANLCRSEVNGRAEAGKIVDIVDDLRLKLAYVKDVISEFKEMSVVDLPIYTQSNGITDYPSPLPPAFESPEAYTANHGTMTHPMSVNTHDSPPDLTRKRCVTDTDAERRVKFKVEPDETSPLPRTNDYTSMNNTSHLHALQSPPPSRSASPPSSHHFVFNPVKPTSNYPPIANGSTQTADNAAAPKFPPLRSAWSESVVPTRHSHSMSTGSISARPVPDTSFHAGGVPQPMVPGRMNRSGSIGGAFVHPFTFAYGKVPPSQWQSTSASHPPAPVSSQTSPDARGVSDNHVHEEDGGDDDDDEDSPSGNQSQLTPTSDVPQEYRSEVDRIFFEYLNKTCSNLDATDSKGESIHQTLMAKKMQRLDESPDFRPFKFRIQAFTNAFLEELAKQGYPEEKIPMKKIRNYLWRHPFIQRYNEDGRKAKSKGNHIWNVEAKKAGDGKWQFRPFHRKLAGPFPGVAYCGLRWHWKPRVWDPQASWQNIPVFYSSPSLPSWLSWKGDELSGTPTPDAQSCDITVIAKFMLDGQESQLSSTFHINVAPRSAMDPAWPSRSTAAAGPVDLPRRASDPMLNRLAARMPPQSPNNVSETTPARVVEVLQNVAARVAEKTEVSLATFSAMGNLNHLAKQRHAVEQSLAAYDLALIGPTPPETHRLAVAAQAVVAEAAQHAVAPRAAAAGITPTPSLAIQVASIGEMTDLTQEALAAAVTMQGSGSNDLDVIQTTSNILAAHKTPNRPPSYAPHSTVVSTFV